jgi:hypothetical protein
VSKAIRFTVLVAAAVCLFAVFATSAFAYSGWWGPCSSCHAAAPTVIAVTPTLVSNDGTDAEYTFTAPGATEWAVFAGYTRRASGFGPSGSFTVPAGALYTIYAVAGDLSGSYGSANVNPAATFPDPTGDVTPPVSVSDAVASYTNKAEITITATDDLSGVAYIYYRVNGGATRTTPIGVDGYAKAYVKPTATGTFNYTLTFWAQDRASGPNGSSPWTYQDASDAAAKREGGYVAYGGVSGFYSNPHGGYDTSTNKCKVCHAVHRAEGTYYLLRANSIKTTRATTATSAAPHTRDKVVYTGNALASTRPTVTPWAPARASRTRPSTRRA